MTKGKADVVRTKEWQAEAASVASTSEQQAQDLFNRQQAYVSSDVTKSYEWRIDQLDHLLGMLKDNYQRFSHASRDDFKTASQENQFEVSASIASTEYTRLQLGAWMKTVEAPIPKFLAASGHKRIVTESPTASP
jgi:aldehyde dehydrogenase (NAD+)